MDNFRYLVTKDIQFMNNHIIPKGKSLRIREFEDKTIVMYSSYKVFNLYSDEAKEHGKIIDIRGFVE